MAWLKKKTCWTYNLCFFALQCSCEAFLTQNKIYQDIVINVHRSSCTMLFILSFFNVTWIFLIHFQKILKCQISWETGRHAEANSCVSPFSECAKEGENCLSVYLGFLCVEQECTDIYGYWQGCHSKGDVFTSRLKYETYHPHGIFNNVYLVLKSVGSMISE
jgi:hypothetical protein